MSSLLPRYEYDIFISYRQKDNKGDRWVTGFVQELKTELEATFKEDISIYFDENPHDGLLETHNVDKSLEGKLKCLVFIPIISQTYCDTRSFAWEHEFCAFNRMAKKDSFGRDIKLSNGNVASRILPVKIHDLDLSDKSSIEQELGGVLRAIEFIYTSAGVNRPLRAVEEDSKGNLNHTAYRNQINKVANAVKEIIGAMRNQGPEATQQNDSRYSAAGNRSVLVGKKLVLPIVIAAILAAVIYYFIMQPFGNDPVDALSTNKAIAVLPFANMSNDPEQEYFSDGLTEELISQLSNLHDLLVISRSSAMTFKGTNKKIGEIADELKVRFILEGSVRKSGKKLLITTSLIDATTDAHLWGEKYNGDLNDVFDIQEKVSRAIVEQLRIELTPEEDRTMSKRPFDNVQAYEYYLQAKRELLQFNGGAFGRAKENLQHALDIIGPDATLYGGMAYVYFSYANLGYDADENWEKADEYARKAFELDPQSPEGHFVLGLMYATRKGNIKLSMQHLKQVLTVRPNDFDALFWLDIVYSSVGESTNSQLIASQLMKINPLSASSLVVTSVNSYYQGRFDLALDPIRKANKMEPENTAWQTFMIMILVQGQHVPEAMEFIDKINDPNSQDGFSQLSFAFKLAIQRDSSALQKLISNPTTHAFLKNDWQYSHIASELCAMASMDTEALSWLENSISRGFANYPYLSKHCPAFVNLRKDPRFQRLMVRVKKEWESFQE